jgi:signal transduction histidine kinase
MKMDNPNHLDSKVSREYSGYINDSAKHLLSVISDILDLSKIEANEWQLVEEEFEFNDVIKSGIMFFSQRCKEKNITIQYECDDRIYTLFGDVRRIKQIILNLLSNAVKFTPENGTITVETKFDEFNNFQISFRDTGIGMDKEEIEIALKLFGQVESDFNRNYEGTGLGLPLVKSFAELHGGFLSLESEKNVGTCATISLPESRVLSNNI